jgi:hypothetical protein
MSLLVPLRPRSRPGSATSLYAAASLLRMFVALALSTIFTFIYGTAADAGLMRPDVVTTRERPE